MSDTLGRPAYQRLADELRSQIADGRLPVGSALPSASQLVKQHGVSTTVVREALKILRNEELIYGQPGKAVYVRATPQETEGERQTLSEVASGLAELREHVTGLHVAADPSAVDQLRDELAEVRRAVGVLQTQLIDLYGRVGQPYPRDAAPLKQAGDPARPRKAANG